MNQQRYSISRRFLTLCLLSLIGLSAAAARKAGQNKKEQEPSDRNTCPDTHAWTGKYKNYSYGFTIVIPKDLKAFWNSATCVSGPDGCTCMSDHGRIIPLSAEPYEPERHIEVYAGFAADLDKPTVSAEITKHLEWVRERSRDNNTEVRERSNVIVGGLKGERVVVRYYDNKLNAWLIEDFIELIRRDINYSLYLRTKEENYDNDRPKFDAIISSFRLTKGENT